MTRHKLHLLLGLTILLMLLATRLQADPLGQVTINGTTYEIFPQADVKSPTTKFKLGSSYYALTPWPAMMPSHAIPLPATQPTPVTQPTTRSCPTALTTGVPAGTVLKPVAKNTITANAVYDGLAITGTQTVKLAAGQTVAFHNCRIDGNNSPYGVRCDGNLGAILIDHCEIFNVASAAIYGDHFQVTSSYIHRSGGDGFKPGVGAIIQGNYIAELGWNAPNAHADGVQINGGSDIRIVGNFFDLPRNLANTKSNAALFLQAAAHDVIFDSNWCRGGNYTIHAFANGNGGPTVQITNNTFFAGSDQYGFGSVGAGVVWTGNVTDAGQPAPCTDK